MEREIIDLGDHDSGADDTAAAGPSRLPGQPIPKGHGRIVRDEAGNVVGVELAEEDEDTQNVADADDDEMRDPEIDPHVRSNWVEDLGASAIEGRRSGVKEDVVKGEFAFCQKKFSSFCRCLRGMLLVYLSIPGSTIAKTPALPRMPRLYCVNAFLMLCTVADAVPSSSRASIFYSRTSEALHVWWRGQLSLAAC